MRVISLQLYSGKVGRSARCRRNQWTDEDVGPDLRPVPEHFETGDIPGKERNHRRTAELSKSVGGEYVVCRQEPGMIQKPRSEDAIHRQELVVQRSVENSVGEIGVRRD